MDCCRELYYLGCQGNNKFLVRSALFTFVMNLVVMIGFFISYWVMVPKFPSKEMEWILLCAVVLLFTLGLIHSSLVLLETVFVNPDPASRRSLTARMSANLDSAEPFVILEPLNGHDDRHQHALNGIIPNSSAQRFEEELADTSRRSFPTEAGNSKELATLMTRIQDRCNIAAERERSNLRRMSSHSYDRTARTNSPNERNDNYYDRASSVPKIIISEPERQEPIYENLERGSALPDRSEIGLLPRPQVNISPKYGASKLKNGRKSLVNYSFNENRGPAFEKQSVEMALHQAIVNSTSSCSGSTNRSDASRESRNRFLHPQSATSNTNISRAESISLGEPLSNRKKSSTSPTRSDTTSGSRNSSDSSWQYVAHAKSIPNVPRVVEPHPASQEQKRYVEQQISNSTPSINLLCKAIRSTTDPSELPRNLNSLEMACNVNKTTDLAQRTCSVKGVHV